jgi:hypothetical protein
MDESKRQETIENLRGGVWTGRNRDRAWRLTGAELIQYLEALSTNPTEAARTVLHCAPSDRKADRANQILKRSGLIRWDSAKRRWMVL